MSDLMNLVQKIQNLTPDCCWVLRVDNLSENPDLTCLRYIGATFPNGTVWTEDMCCLPCRLRKVVE